MMTRSRFALGLAVLFLIAGSIHAETPQTVKETVLDAPRDVKIKIRMEGPYTADVPLQVVCYFPYTPEAVKRMSGAPVELDRHLGGVIGSLRQRGEFSGDEQETLLLIPPSKSIPAKKLLLVGFGPEQDLSLDVLARVGRTALREAALADASRVAFAPLIRDQGNTSFPAGDVEVALLKSVLLAYDTQKRLEAEGLADKYTLKEWIVEAGPAFFDETVIGAQKAIQEAEAAIAQRFTAPYGTTAK